MTVLNLNTANVAFFEHLRATDVDTVGGKNSSLGELISQLAQAGVRVPGGFATTAQAFKTFLHINALTDKINDALTKLNPDDTQELAKVGAQIRQWVIDAPLQAELEADIRTAFNTMAAGHDISVAVRSSATAEDLPDASFAGQQESYLNVVGVD
jgi:pyruvate, water dikinase